MSEFLKISLTFEGSYADDHLLDMYDGARAVAGFQRSLAITTHLILNDEIITQAPSLKGASILMPPFQEGSWKTIALVAFGTTITAAGTASQDSFYGHMVASAYSYVMKEATGMEANYESTIQSQIEGFNALKDGKLNQSRLDAAVEKSENSIIDMHRPMVKSRTAGSARIENENGAFPKPEYPVLNPASFEYLSITNQSKAPQTLIAKVTSYNINTHSGRAYFPDLGKRTISFKLSDQCQNITSVMKVTRSLSKTAESVSNEGFVYLTFLRNESVSGRTKSIYVLNVLSVEEYERSQTYLN